MVRGLKGYHWRRRPWPHAVPLSPARDTNADRQRSEQRQAEPQVREFTPRVGVRRSGAREKLDQSKDADGNETEGHPVEEPAFADVKADGKAAFRLLSVSVS